MADSVSPGMDPAQYPLATQREATLLMVPYSIGWQIQVLLTGLATNYAIRILRKRRAALYAIPCGTNLLIAAVVCNIAATAVNMAENTVWMASQNRSLQGMVSTKTIDVAAPFLDGLACALVQLLLALRCMRILTYGMYLIWPMLLLLLASLAGNIVITVATCQSDRCNGLLCTDARCASDRLMADTSADAEWFIIGSQLAAWTGMALDASIAASLVYYLYSMRRGFNSRTDAFITNIMKSTLETFAIPTIFNLVAAILFALVGNYNDPPLYNFPVLVSCKRCVQRLGPATDATETAFLPSVYLLSFVQCVRGTHRNRDSRVSDDYSMPSRRQTEQKRASVNRSGSGLCRVQYPATLPTSCSDAVIAVPPSSTQRPHDSQQRVRPRFIDSWSAPPSWQSRTEPQPEVLVTLLPHLGYADPSRDLQDVEGKECESKGMV